MADRSGESVELEQLLEDRGIKGVAGHGDADLRAFNYLIRSLPSEAVKDLLSVGCTTLFQICSRCILRLFGIPEPVGCSPLPLASIFCRVLGVLESPENVEDSGVEEDEGIKEACRSEESDAEPAVCNICLGILQFSCNDDKKVLERKEGADGLATTIAEVVKQQGHQIDSFSLEVSVPPIVQENERKVWLSMKRKYGSHILFQEKSTSECISLKDALKSLIVVPLEELLGAKSGKDAFKIRLTYTEPSNKIERDQLPKKRKIGTENGSDMVDELTTAGAGCTDNSAWEETSINGTYFNGQADPEISECFKLLPKKVMEPCSFSLHCSRNPIYFSGRYLKYSRNVSQTCWMIEDERKGEASVEEIIGSCILPISGGDKYKFHAAGREDIDVRMLGSGRPFLIEIQNARNVPSEVSVRNLKVVGSEGWSMMREGEAEKQKQYAALVWISRPLEDADLQKISSIKDIGVLQRTPIRVLHRRSPLEREKVIHWMKIDKIAGSSQYFILHLCTQAGTYIKEFVHGDLGRTHPSIGSVLECRAEILQLDVTDVKMDSF
ncbi:hypothetical protein CDL15_Pgr007429 [Punica granatum]|uniref:tRNA pseudouridine(55) synthase n=1 Tax=Punica granatum TaxID=22663 RepID=A0A218XA49_PUNGR|nr:hypothetical protein CDL15_Pgr007429 [Punica granatum]